MFEAVQTNMTFFRKFIFASCASTAVFNAFVWKKRQSIRGINTFKPGTPDEMLMETLRPGDIILFQRAWNTYYLPQALSVALYQYLHDSSLDHCGMVIQDKMGELYVFELSPSGYVCTPYRNRIHESHSTSIVLFPVESPEYEESPIKYRERVFDEVQHAISRNDQPYEPLEIIKGCISKILTDNEAYTSFVPKKYFEYPYSPSLQIVMNVLSISTDIDFEHIDNISKERIVADDFFMRKVRILEKPVEPSHQRKLTKLGSATVIRDM